MTNNRYTTATKLALFAVTAGVLGFESAALAIPTLTLTETSQSNIHYSWSDGGPSGELVLKLITNPENSLYGPNASVGDFIIHSPDFGNSNDDLQFRWKEPGGNEVNLVNAVWYDRSPDYIFRLVIASDSTYPDFPLVEDGATVKSTQAGRFAVRFVDLAPEGPPPTNAPDTGATSTLLALSFAGFAGAVRFRR